MTTGFSVESELSRTLDQSRRAQAWAEALKVQVHEDTRGSMAKNQPVHVLIQVSKGVQPWELQKNSFRGNKERSNYSHM